MIKNSVYRDKNVLVTGHTGFKGSWLCSWLCELGANVHGLSNEVPTEPALYNEVLLKHRITDYRCDVRDTQKLTEIIRDIKPDYIFHLAAQAIVSESYIDPLTTITTNVCGTANILDIMRLYEHPCNVVIITSDKCYENVEQIWGYREIDSMGGKDIYSASKGAAELIFHAYSRSFLNAKPNIKLASARAGNVIGGGDWAMDRLIVDCVRKWSASEKVEVRSPAATRPWQHVLEPLSGYLVLGAQLSQNEHISGQSFNFGPPPDQNRNVLEVIENLAENWGFDNPQESYEITNTIPFNEAGLLKLDCSKGKAILNWEPTLSYEMCIEFVASWYRNYYYGEIDSLKFTVQQIAEYEEKSNLRQLLVLE
jgi:CDP-glucose 4,6-dehydratase